MELDREEVVRRSYVGACTSSTCTTLFGAVRRVYDAAGACPLRVRLRAHTHCATTFIKMHGVRACNGVRLTSWRYNIGGGDITISPFTC